MVDFGGGGSQNPVQSAMPKLETQLAPAQAPIGKRPKPKNAAATFLGADAAPGPASANFGGKTLMGQ